jgi:hypothetical protein
MEIEPFWEQSMNEASFSTNRTFQSSDLIPRSWQTEPNWQQFFVLNPSIIARDDHYLMLYRVIAPNYASRRLATCLLDQALRLVPDSVAPFSDTIPNQDLVIGDPRLVRFNDRTYSYFNTIHRPGILYLVELDLDTRAARGAARPMVLDEPRRAIEKNWMLFEYEGELLIEYTLTPHVILHAEVKDEGAIRCRRIYGVDWDASDYARRYGEPRGGTPPIRIGDTYFSFFHSSHLLGWLHPVLRKMRAWLWEFFSEHGEMTAVNERSLAARIDAPGGRRRQLPLWLSRLRGMYVKRFIRRRYVGAFYGFRAHPPFLPCLLTPDSVMEPEGPHYNPNILNPLNPQVVFPGGAVLTKDRNWVVAYGVHDERCAVRVFSHADLLRRCRPVQ